MSSKSEALTIFSWGYWGWGNATREFVEAADTVEGSRGFGPPVFFDARIRRSVRAAGFRDNAFERLLGDRYRWMQGLGNKNLDGGPMALDKPQDVERLLDHALDLGEQRRRLLFFCSCEFRFADGVPHCHRCLIADELVQRAKRRGLAATVVEWPGTLLGKKPEEWDLPAKTVKSVVQGRKSFVAGELPLARVAGLPWGLPVWLKSDSLHVATFVGPARFQGKQWVVPIIGPVRDQVTDKELIADALEFRRSAGFEPVE